MEKLIIRATELMQEIKQNYQKLSSVCEQLITAFINGRAESIEILTRIGQVELLGIRAKLSQLTWVLSNFTNQRDNISEPGLLSIKEKSAFELASKELIIETKIFQKTCEKTSSLAVNGIAFATVYLQAYGIEPTTYRAPYSKRRNKT